MRAPLRLALASLGALAAAAGCLTIDSNAISISYAFQPQPFSADFGAQAGSVPDVSCAANANACATLPAMGGATPSCDAATRKCILTADLKLVQTVNLSQQSGFPSEVANAKVIQQVVVDQIRFWTPTNTLSFDTPPIDLYVGGQSVQSEVGASKLGTLPVIPKGERSAQMSPRQVALTDSGKSALGGFARDYKTPFNIVVVVHLVARGGQAIPSGRLDLSLQPVVAFKIPLK